MYRGDQQRNAEARSETAQNPLLDPALREAHLARRPSCSARRGSRKTGSLKAMRAAGAKPRYGRRDRKSNAARVGIYVRQEMVVKVKSRRAQLPPHPL
jgi:hypothetical protein